MLYKVMTRKLTKASPGDAESSDLNRHERKCLVCNHPERAAIEDEYLHWHHPHSIAIDFDLRERNIYDHAKATGLRALRAQDRRSVLELILQKAEHAKVTGETIIRALRAYSCLSDDGRWAEPESRVVFSYKPAMAESRSTLALPAPMHEASDVTAGVAILPLPTVAELPAKAGAVLDLPPVEALPLAAEADLLAKAGDQFLIGSPSD
jgi:hypothetical protein